MIYPTARDWRAAPAKRVTLFGMSGLGKTHISNLLRASGGWFHYSVDYRIGTRYMGEHIADNFKREAMKVPLLRELLLTDSVYIQSNITFDNLAPLSTYLGKPGDPSKGGLPFDEYMRRQELHRQAEVSAMLDTAHFIERAKTLYGYDHFVCDTSGSICEVVDPTDPVDPVLTALSDQLLMVWIEGTEAHTEELIRRFPESPQAFEVTSGQGADLLGFLLARREVIQEENLAGLTDEERTALASDSDITAGLGGRGRQSMEGVRRRMVYLSRRPNMVFPPPQRALEAADRRQEAELETLKKELGAGAAADSLSAVPTPYPGSLGVAAPADSTGAVTGLPGPGIGPDGQTLPEGTQAGPATLEEARKQAEAAAQEAGKTEDEKKDEKKDEDEKKKKKKLDENWDFLR